MRDAATTGAMPRRRRSDAADAGVRAVLHGSVAWEPADTQFSGDDDEDNDALWARTHAAQFAFVSVAPGTHTIQIPVPEELTLHRGLRRASLTPNQRQRHKLSESGGGQPPPRFSCFPPRAKTRVRMNAPHASAPIRIYSVRAGALSRTDGQSAAKLPCGGQGLAGPALIFTRRKSVAAVAARDTKREGEHSTHHFRGLPRACSNPRPHSSQTRRIYLFRQHFSRLIRR
jgi:hypothetical protein